MDLKTFYAILGLSHIIFVASFVFSVKASFVSYFPDYLRQFYYYPLITLVMCVFLWLDYFNVTPTGLYSNLNFLSLSFHFIFLTSFILQALKESALYNWASSTRKLSIVLILICMLTDYMHQSNRSYIIVNALLFFYCFFYFSSLLKNRLQERLVSRPEFWVISGIFSGMGIILPFYIFHEFLTTRVSNNTINLLRLIGGLGYVTMHLFLIKGFLSKSPSVNNYLKTNKIKTQAVLRKLR